MLTRHKATPTEIQEVTAVRVEQPAAEVAAVDQALVTPMHTAVQSYSMKSAAEGASQGGEVCSAQRRPQQYPRFTVVYVWVVTVLVGAFVCVVCSNIIWPWLFFDPAEYPAEYGLFASASIRSYSLLDVWGTWKLSSSVKGSLVALGSCDLWRVTCNLTAV
jgi:hypothetical protein